MNYYVKLQKIETLSDFPMNFYLTRIKIACYPALTPA
jgi:hypothetical protein